MTKEGQAVQRKDKEENLLFSLNNFSAFDLVWQYNSICEVFWKANKAFASHMH